MIRSSDIQHTLANIVAMKCILATATVLMVLAAPAQAASAEHRTCLSRVEQRAALSKGQAVTLEAAIRSARASVHGRGTREVVRARLCREDQGLVYLLTLLTRDGKVTHTAVDATSGKVVDVR
jgi:uncharacterized membrane protein YkoI